MRMLLVVVAIVAGSAVAFTDDPKTAYGKDAAAAKEAEADAAAAKAKKDAKMAAVNKVIVMMESLQTKVLAEGEVEAASYNKFACFCKDQTNEKTASIKKGQDDKSTLEGDIETLEEKRAKLDKKISYEPDKDEVFAETAGLQQWIAKTEDEMDKAKKARAATLEEYTTNKNDLKAALDALKGAIKSLKASNKGTSTEAVSMLQFQSVSKTVRQALLLADALGLGTKETRQATAAFLQDEPGANPSVEMEDYKFHSNSIIDTLEGLLKDFTDMKNEIDADEVKSVQEHDILMQEKTSLLKEKNLALSKAQKDKAQTQKDLEGKSQELTTVTATLLDDQEYLEKLAKMCSDKAITWNERSKVREAELSTLTEVIGIIRAKVATKTSKGTIRFAQTGASVRLAEAVATSPGAAEAIEAEAEAVDTNEAAVSFLQRRKSGFLQRQVPEEEVRDQIAALLKGTGDKLKSTLLIGLAGRIGADPLAKVKALIQDLIERLLQEAANEANQKGWCDKATADATQKRDYAAQEIEELNGLMAGLEAKINKLTMEIGELTDEIDKLEKAQDEADEQRREDKAENEATIEEASEGLEALNMAIDILDKFYKTSAQATVDLKGNKFLQAPPAVDPMDEAPDTAFKTGEAYTAGQGESGGILGMMDVMKSDFERTIRETEKAEAKEKKDHLTFSTETGVSLAEKNMAKDQKTTQNADANTEFDTAEDTLTTQTTILKTAIKELIELKATCVDTGMSYEERVALREEEIEALKKALCILTNYAKYGSAGASANC